VAFSRSEPTEQLRAIGAIGELPPQLQRAFSIGPEFEPIPEPGPGDWLRVARERGQTFERFTAVSRTAGDDGEGQRRIYLRPIGDFLPEHSTLLEQLRRFGSEFFARELQVLPPLDIAANKITTRRNRFTDALQLKTRDILPALARTLPSDAACVLGFSAFDLYPHDTWSFVFGEALLGDRVGVFSIARYDPAFYDKPADDPSLILRRSCKVLAHEACHMFGIQHCVYFNCLMNGSNHLAESDRRPLHLCPVDLRKLHWSFRFDLADRYRRLRAFWLDAGVEDEAAWIARRLEFIERG
jgi:archaemetzincin